MQELELPPDDANRIHSWHLFPIKLNLNRLSIDRNAFVEELKRRGVGCSVHWRPLHLQPLLRASVRLAAGRSARRNSGMAASDKPASFPRNE